MKHIMKSYADSGRRQTSVVLIAVLLAFALRVYRLASQSYWWDELTTVGSSLLSLGEMLDYQFDNISHLPFYFILMQGWIGIGDGEFTMRYFSVLFGVLTIALIYKSGELVSGRVVGLVATLILAFSPFNIWYSQEARMYTFIAFTVLAAHWFLLKILDGGGYVNWIGYFFAMLASVYSHYLTIFILVSHYTFFSIHYRFNKQHLRTWLIYGGAVGFLFSIWIGAILINGGFSNAPIGWIASAHWYEPILTFVSLSIGPTINPKNPIFYLVPVLFFTGITIGLRKYFHFSKLTGKPDYFQKRTLFFRLLITWLILPIFLTYLVSLDLQIPRQRSVYMDRYLIITLPALVLLAAWGIVSLVQSTKRRWLLPVGMALIIGVSILSLSNMYFVSDYARDNWRKALFTMKDEWERGDVYLVKPGQALVDFQYGSDITRTEFVPYFFQPQTKDNFDDDDIKSWVQSATEDSDRAWLITAVENVNPHGFPQTRTEALKSKSVAGPMEKWMDQYCSDPKQWRFTGILLSRYELPSCMFPG